MSEQRGKIAHIVINDCGCYSSMLNLRMPADIVSWTKNTINCFDILLIPLDIGFMEIKTLELMIYSVIIEPFPE